MKSSDYKFLIVDDARAVVTEQAKYISERGNPENAKKWKSTFFRTLREIATFPYKYPQHINKFGDPSKFRRTVILDHTVYYAIDEKEKLVIVVLIRHGALET